LGWHVELIDDKSFYILVDFSHPALVSQKNNDLDRLQVKILHIEAFVNEDEKQATAPESTIVVSKVPTLINTEFTQPETIDSVKGSFAETVKAIMAGNFLISILMAGALQYLWGMINAL